MANFWSSKYTTTVWEDELCDFFIHFRALTDYNFNKITIDDNSINIIENNDNYDIYIAKNNDSYFLCTIKDNYDHPNYVIDLTTEFDYEYIYKMTKKFHHDIKSMYENHENIRNNNFNLALQQYQNELKYFLNMFCQ